MDGLDCLGAENADEVGFDYGSLLQAAGGVATYGVSAAEAEKKESSDKSADDKKVKDAIAADVAAASAIAKAAVSAQLKNPSAAMDATAADMAVAAEDKAGGAGLSPDGAKRRADAADTALAAAVKLAQSKPADQFAAAMVKAWQATANKAHSTAIASSDGSDSGGKHGKGDKGGSGGSWLTKPAIGRLPGYGILAVGAGLLGLVVVVLKKFVFKRAAV